MSLAKVALIFSSSGRPIRPSRSRTFGSGAAGEILQKRLELDQHARRRRRRGVGAAIGHLGLQIGKLLVRDFRQTRQLLLDVFALFGVLGGHLQAGAIAYAFATAGPVEPS